MKRTKEQSKNPSSLFQDDNKLYSRIYKILETETITDVESILANLQRTYPEYGRKKRLVLKRSVQKCIDKIVNDFDIEDASDNDDDILQSTNHVNNTLNQLYNNDVGKNSDDKGKRTNIDVQRSNFSNAAASSSTSSKRSRIEEKIERDIESTLVKQAALRQRYLVEPKVRFEDFGGLDDVIEDIQRLVFHIHNQDLYRKLGVDAPRGFLLHGPPGVGKSLLVEALANDLQIAYLRCGATEIVAGISGESEEKIRQLFALAKELKPCLLFIDEIDAITPKRENAAREMERRIVTQVITCMDELSASDGSGHGVMVIGATNRPDSLDPALRRAGRFDREIALGIPDEKSRLEIIRVLFRNIKVDSNFDFQSLAHRTPGYVGADLKSLIREAAILALERFMNPSSTPTITIEQIDETNFQIEMCDFDGALKRVQPSSKREGFATVPDVTWSDVGALSDIRQELQLSILAPVRFACDVEKLGLSLSVGILLCGPPGCGKTLLAKAIANESGINFISVKGPELLNMYVGESERAVRSVFNRARCSKPCVIFFDEIDALCPRRTDSSDSSNVTSRVVNQLLTEMDGLESRDCFLLAATNRPDILDPAILRPGRFDKILHVGFPTAKDRFEILCTMTKNKTKPPISSDVDLEQLASDPRLDGFTGADLSALIREASLNALRQKIDGILPFDKDLILNFEHFDAALNKVRPSVSIVDRQRYNQMQSLFTETINRK
ncbi:hypothetical protein DERP_014589 [Dermatophagoides pteronyssinus]|uniref:AAA+ ATPase domain-containing protein n=1 Tax=Dermatophagoides pteronyssinus TaxID=6956 RepID=A0ABQ8IQ27_DERPT|nr:hypothetical protein DERP_014589 [Dermatophagoides pteronyssinus]